MFSDLAGIFYFQGEELLPLSERSPKPRPGLSGCHGTWTFRAGLCGALLPTVHWARPRNGPECSPACPAYRHGADSRGTHWDWRGDVEAHPQLFPRSLQHTVRWQQQDAAGGPPRGTSSVALCSSTCAIPTVFVPFPLTVTGWLLLGGRPTYSSPGSALTGVETTHVPWPAQARKDY